jgi:MtN3 and saliva related transmembrane protein
MSLDHSAIQVVGLIGGATIALSLLPQVYKTYRTRSAADISYFYQGVYIVGCTLGNIYALYEGLWPIYIPGLFEEFMIILLTWMKIYFECCND